jgi:hypothetical protein
MLSQVLRSKTVWYAVLIAILSVLQGYVFLLPITPVQQMFVGVAVSVGVLILRLVTTQPIAAK